MEVQLGASIFTPGLPWLAYQVGQLWCIVRHMRLCVLLLTCISAIGLAQNPSTAGNKAPSSTPADTAGDATTEALVSAKALLAKGKFEEASAAFKALVDKDPKSAEAHVGLIRSLYRDDKLDEAEAAARNAIGVLPGSALIQATMGDLDFREGKFADAEAAYRASLKLDPHSARGLFGMGRMFQMVSMPKMAKVALTQAHEADPNDSQIYNQWLRTLSYAEQLEILKKAVGDHPTAREQQHLQFLSEAVQKKPWTVATPIQATEIKMTPYGREQEYVFRANGEGVIPKSKGFGLEVKFNDRASSVLLLDTGAGGITIGRKLGQKAGVVKIGDTYISGIGDQGPVESYFGWVDKITIGSLEFRNCIVEVSSKSDVADEAGLIGGDVFEKFLITLDFKNWRMLLAPLPRNPNAPANSSTDDEAPQDRYIAPEMQSFTKIWRFGHHLVIPVVVSDKATGNFVLDTGSDSNTISPRLAQQITKLRAEGEKVKGISGTAHVQTGDKAILQFGKVRVRSDDLAAFALHLSSPDGTEYAGLIGIKTLVQMKFTIDYRDGLVNFEPYEFKPARE